MRELIGKRIRERRKELRMSQETLAEKSSVSRMTIISLENGKCDNPLVKTLSDIALALDTTVEFFLN